MDSQFLLNTLRQSPSFKKRSELDSGHITAFQRGRVLAQLTSRNGNCVVPSLNTTELLGFFEYVLEHTNDTNNQAS